MSADLVYFDYNSTTPPEPEVVAAMMPYLTGEYGNASSRHEFGRRAHAAVENAREEVADAVGARADQVVFTSSGTESNNMLIKGVAAVSARQNVAVGATEHPCVLCTARSLQRMCFGFAPIAVDADGIIDDEDLERSLETECAVVSVMLANNETGVLQDIAAIAPKARESGAVMHTDAAQALGKVPVDFGKLGVDAMTISGHKAYGPKGVAALVVRREVNFVPLLDGGGHEGGLRSGTENVPGIVGFGKAAQLAKARAQDNARTAALRDAIEADLLAMGALVFGAAAPRLPNTCYLGFPGVDGESLVVMLDQAGFGVTSGSACANMKDEPSHVLLAMGVPADDARSAVRISIGAWTTSAEVEAFAGAMRGSVERLKSLSAVAM
jgi:cysteine desulfurase